jgi:endonuclease G
MSFNGYLSNKDIEALVQAALNGGLLEVPRAVLVNGIPPAFIGSIDDLLPPLDRFSVLLVQINQVERMASGQVPLVTLLENAAARLRLAGRVEAAVFEEKLNRVSNRAGGVPQLPDPATLPEVLSNEAIIGEDDMVEVSFLTRGLEVGRAVARIKVRRYNDGVPAKANNGDPWVMQGTAWLIAPGIAITNHHVVNARLPEEPAASAADFELQAKNAAVEFDFDLKDSPLVPVPVTKLLAASAGLDYAILELTGAPARDIPKLLPNRIVDLPTSRIAVNIVQHPRGEPKRVAFRNNLVSAADQTTLRYFTDTDYGSSGSPVCDDQWRVVALHRGARHASGVSYKGKDTAYINFGSQIQAVLDDVRARDQAIADLITH